MSVQANAVSIGYEKHNAVSTDADVCRDALKMGRCSVHQDVQVQKYSTTRSFLFFELLRKFHQNMCQDFLKEVLKVSCWKNFPAQFAKKRSHLFLFS